MPSCSSAVYSSGAMSGAHNILLVCAQNTIAASNEVCVKQTQKALTIAIPLVTAGYMVLGCAGYAAFGGYSTFTVDSLLKDSPHWVANLLLILLLIHMVGIYQVS